MIRGACVGGEFTFAAEPGDDHGRHKAEHDVEHEDRRLHARVGFREVAGATHRGHRDPELADRLGGDVAEGRLVIQDEHLLPSDRSHDSPPLCILLSGRDLEAGDRPALVEGEVQPPPVLARGSRDVPQAHADARRGRR